MLEVKKRRNIKKIWVVLSIFAFIISITIIIWFVFQSRVVAPDQTSKNEKVIVKPILPTSISSNVLFLGNTFWGRYIDDWSMASPLKYQYPFSRLNELNRDQYDAWISGLECPTVAGVHMTSAEQEQALQFNCSPDYLPEAAKWFTAFTLANNHTDNQGVDGFNETRQQFDKNGIQYFGHYDPSVIEDNCEVIGLPVTVINDNKSSAKGKLPVAMCGYHGVFKIPPQEAIAEMQKYSKYMPVVAMPHMGVEYKTAPDGLKVGVYRSMIDNGADMVIGDHPHWIQNSESYNGHLIVYSLGNFMFDQQDTAEVVRSASIRAVMKSGVQNSDLLQKWLKIGESCSKFKDDCLDQVTKQNLTKLDMTYQFDALGTNDSGKIAKQATPEQLNSILQRLNWQSTVKNLQPPYSSL
jgi:poly-gamma-glutamate synthesis protein (capsule biosynthesis protein)